MAAGAARWSMSHTESNPAASAARTRSRIRSNPMRSCGKNAPNHIAQEGSVGRVSRPLHHAALRVRDVDATLRRLRGVGFGEDARRIEQPGPLGPVSMATVRDPDSVVVELIHGSQPGA